MAIVVATRRPKLSPREEASLPLVRETLDASGLLVRDLAMLVWNHYGVSSSVGRACDRGWKNIERARLATCGYAEDIAERADPGSVPFDWCLRSCPNRFSFERRDRLRPPQSMPAELHIEAGSHVKRALGDLSRVERGLLKSWRLAAFVRRTEYNLNRIRCAMDNCGFRDHGERCISDGWYYGPASDRTRDEHGHGGD